ncbi:MAG: hypothetical protein FWD76_04850 [Firmicutes bacterium]|nr:hypothetical protein [Bacillota bacterium]
MYTHQELVARLQELAGEARVGYKEFIASLNPTASPSFGVPLGLLWKETSKVSLEILTDNTLEEQLLKSVLLGKSKDFEKVKSFVPKIHDWAVCDKLSSECKFLDKDRNTYFDKVLGLDDGTEFGGRAALVMMEGHFVVDTHIDSVLQAVRTIVCKVDERECALVESGDLVSKKSREQYFYYTKMGAAWCLATCFEKFQEKTMAFFAQADLPHWVHNKGIRKACESRRITDENKTIIKQLLR